ncbi:amidohydrolase family protein [Stenotrophomonas sp. SY1]|uniref:amidohydrolase family protein n=1 Tax=Stenotrophomonas sp. SY1 TaxID=477235 RepID=UPI001E6082EC|nr:amidohydrolase family protein [Stenotrophomonas sp. SY1]MCD9085705.1 amidohydrolase family protein [Stenotrophomonas sp. SY1]
MRRDIGQALIALLVCASLLGCNSVATTHVVPAGVLYHGFSLVDPNAERVVDDAYVLINDGKIAAVGTGEWKGPAPERSVDMTGHYALPGLIDGHAHITSGPHSVEVVDGDPLISIPSVDAITRHNAAVALAFGITTVRNPGGDPAANARYDAQIRTGALLGPEALHAGAVIQPPPFGGTAFAYPRSETEWNAEARRQADMGMRYFKLYSGLDADELKQGIQAAHRNGLKAIAHLDTISWTQAARLGIDGLEHTLPTSSDLLEPKQRATYLAERGADARYLFRWFELADFDGPLIQEMLVVLAQRRVVVSTTLGVNELTYNSDRLDSVLPPEDRAYFHPANLEALLSFLPRMSEEDHRKARAAMPKVLDFARRLHAAGVPILVGTDGNGGGPAYSRELQLHLRAGIRDWDVLRLATSDAADALGIGNRTGRIAEGMEADIVFFGSNPLGDPAGLREVTLVLTDGKAGTPEQILGSVDFESRTASIVRR